MFEVINRVRKFMHLLMTVTVSLNVPKYNITREFQAKFHNSEDYLKIMKSNDNFYNVNCSNNKCISSGAVTTVLL